MAFLDELDDLDFGSLLGGSFRATPEHFTASQDIENLAATGAISAQEADFRKARNLIGTGFSPPLAAAGAYPYQIGQEVLRDVRDQGISGSALLPFSSGIGSGLRRGAQAGWDNLRGIGAGIYDRIHGSAVPSGINQAQLDQEMSISNPNARLLASVGPLPSGMLSSAGQPPPSQNVGWDTGVISNVPGAAQQAAALNAQAQSRVSPPPPQLRPPLSPPDISQYWPPGGDSIKPEIPTLGPEMIFDPPPDWRPSTDHEFNVAQREKTKARLATDRAKTKKHYAKLRAQGASPKTIAKAKAKSKARSAKIKGQSVRRKTMS